MFNVYSGTIELNNEFYIFDYNNRILRVKFPTSKKSNNYSTNTLCGKLFPFNNKIIFFREKEYSNFYSVRAFDSDMIITYSNSSFNDKLIKRLRFELDELDCFYDFDSSNYNYSLSKRLLHLSNITFHCNSIESKKFSLCIDNNDMLYSIEVVGSYSPDSLQPFSYKVFLSIYFDFDYDYSLIYKTIDNVRKLFSFLSYRKNIKFKSILFSMVDDNNYYDIGHIEYNSIFYNDYVSPEYIKKSTLKYSNISNFLPTIFQNIVDEKVGIRNIPDNQMIKNISSPERIIMIASSFEMIYDALNISIKHSPKSLNSIEKISLGLEDLINSSSFNHSEKEKIHFFQKRLYDESFSSKLNEVLKIYQFIESEVKKVFKYYGKNYVRYNLTLSLERLRNSMAHYKLDVDISENRAVNLKCLEIITYALQLVKCGMDEENIIDVISILLDYKV